MEIKQNLNNLLHLYVEDGDLAKVKHVVELGADINALDQFGETILMKCALMNLGAITEYILTQNPDLTLENDESATAQMIAEQNNSLDFLKILSHFIFKSVYSNN